ncbi:MAG: zinc ribbon domain-containing protein [Gammaproteobacteria bacterium]|nr:zinc ribbon domain-containing protein [Gammaproteobacteria bacterium]
MYRTCPKCGYKLKDSNDALEDQCPECGIVFSKWLKMQLKPLPAVDSAPSNTTRFNVVRTGAWAWFKGKLFYIEPEIDAISVYTRLAVLCVAVAWGMKFILADYTVVSGGMPESSDFIMGRVNLVFHEAGHLIFSPFGDFMGVLGGSLGQLLMPLIVCLAFLFRYNNPFGASIGLWWLGQSAINLAPYIADARAKQLLLLGGITGRDSPAYHDWANLLGRKGWMRHDQEIAAAVDFAGEALMVLSFVWGAYLVWIQLRRIRS